MYNFDIAKNCMWSNLSNTSTLQLKFVEYSI